MEKMRLFVSIIATAMLLVASSANAAVTFNVDVTSDSGRDTSALLPGDTITIDITMRSDGERVFGLGASIFGYDPGSLSLVSGTTSASALIAFYAGTPGAGFGGIDNSFPNVTQGANQISFFSGVSTAGTVATGAADVSPITMEAGGPQARIVLEVLANTSFTVGANAALGGGVVGDAGAFLTSVDAVRSVALIPEPGTALLMGLGLAGLASAGRRK